MADSPALPPAAPPDPFPAWGTRDTVTFAAGLVLGSSPTGDDEPVPGGATVDLRGLTSAVAPPAGGTPTADGRYLVGEEIGRGGVGAVHRGWDLHLGRDVAVKVLLDEHRHKPAIARRFLEEARITSRLRHPGVMAVHDHGIAPDGRPFFTMELVEGETFDHVLRRRPCPSADLPRLLAVFLQISQAVAYAHRHRVIHRDLKPANVMVAAFGTVKVMDWGLAKVLGEPDLPDAVSAARAAAARTAAGGDVGLGTQCGTVFGTPAYLPPEQARGEIDRVDQRADVFGLGSVLCEILTGRPPYTGPDAHAVYAKAAAADLDDAVARLDACPAPLDVIALARWCLAAAPADRPATAEDVVEVMTAFLLADQRRAEQDLVRFFELSLDLFCIAGTDGYFRRVNANFPRLLGHPPEELTARPFLEFVHPDDRERTVAVCERMAEGEQCVRFVNRYRKADGGYVWLEWNAQTVLAERVIYAVARDVTEQRAAAARLAAMMEAAV